MCWQRACSRAVCSSSSRRLTRRLAKRNSAANLRILEFTMAAEIRALFKMQRRRTLRNETLGRRGAPDELVDEITEMSCQEPLPHAATVSLIEADQTQCQIPLTRVAQQCREWCLGRMNSRPIICTEGCRKWITMHDLVDNQVYAGFGALLKYFVNPEGTLCGVTCLLPTTSDLIARLRTW